MSTSLTRFYSAQVPAGAAQRAVLGPQRLEAIYIFHGFQRRPWHYNKALTPKHYGLISHSPIIATVSSSKKVHRHSERTAMSCRNCNANANSTTTIERLHAENSALKAQVVSLQNEKRAMARALEAEKARADEATARRIKLARQFSDLMHEDRRVAQRT